MNVKDHRTADLAPTDFLDYRSPEVQDFVARWAPAAGSTDTERAVSLYYAVRDTVRYEVYGADFSRSGLRASHIARTGSGLCIHKSGFMQRPCGPSRYPADWYSPTCATT